MRRPLSQDELVGHLDGWAGDDVAVRVVTEQDDLVMVSVGQLGLRSDQKHPALFWPLLGEGHSDRPETPGIYLHPEHFEEGAVHKGDFVLELRQGGVTVNIRRL